MKGSNIIENLWWDVHLNQVLQKLGSLMISWKGTLQVTALKDLSQLNPRLYILTVLLRHLCQMEVSDTEAHIQQLALPI